MRKRLSKKLRKRLGLWWIEPIEETLREMDAKVPPVPQPAPSITLPSGFKPVIVPTGS